MTGFSSRRFSHMTADGLSFTVGPENGPPLVLLHGVLRRWQDFALLLPALSARHQVIGLDFRGHGRSKRHPDSSYRVVDYVEDAVALIQQKVTGQVILFGHSLGAMVAAATAAAVPEQVAAVILEDPPFDTMGSRIHSTPFGSYFQHVQSTVRNYQNSVDEMTAALARIPVGSDPPLQLGDVRDVVSLRFSAACLRQIDPQVLEPIVDAAWLEGYETDSILGQISAPTLLMQADYAAGGMMSDEDATRVADRIESCSRIQFPRTGHLIHWAETAACLRHSIAFIESLR